MMTIRWEYMLLQIGTGHSADALEAKMNLWGRDGWELADIQDTGGTPLWIFKRPLYASNTTSQPREE